MTKSIGESDFNDYETIDAEHRYFSDGWVSWYEWSVRKNGKQGTRLIKKDAAICRLYKCDICGRIGTKRRVRLFFHTGRYERIGEMRWLCTGCWNRFRAVWKKQDEADECKYLLNKLHRTITDERKNQNHGRA